MRYSETLKRTTVKNDRTFAENLRRACEPHESIASICQAIGMNRQQFMRYLAGQALPNAVSLHKICAYLGVSEQDLIGGTTLDDTLTYQASRNRDAIDAFSFLTEVGNGISLSISTLKPGIYYCYTPFPSAPDMCVVSLLGVWKKERHKSFTRLTRLSEPGTGGSLDFALAKHKGSVFATDNQIYLMGLNKYSPRQLSLMTIDLGQLNFQDSFVGNIVTRSSNGFFATKFVMLPKRDKHPLKSTIKRLGIISYAEASLPNLVRATLS
jgi:transcriptional regulator with XRE-family HTH domain